jgi:probable addiction module antidote protein
MRVAARKKPRSSKSSPYDVAEHLRSPEEMAAYLDAWLDGAADDVSGIARALGDIARAKGMSQVAKATGLSRESLYRALSEGGNPSFATVLKVARALGLRLHAQFLAVRHRAYAGGSDQRRGSKCLVVAEPGREGARQFAQHCRSTPLHVSEYANMPPACFLSSITIRMSSRISSHGRLTYLPTMHGWSSCSRSTDLT